MTDVQILLAIASMFVTSMAVTITVIIAVIRSSISSAKFELTMMLEQHHIDNGSS